MLKFALVFMLVSVSAFAQQEEFDFGHPDKVLLATYPGDSNTRVVQLDKLPKQIKRAWEHTDIGFEMGDGYYDAQAQAIYMVFSKDGKVIGYMFTEVLSYTQGDQYYLVSVYVNTRGRRLNEELGARPFDADEIKDLPEELQFEIED